MQINREEHTRNPDVVTQSAFMPYFNQSFNLQDYVNGMKKPKGMTQYTRVGKAQSKEF